MELAASLTANADQQETSTHSKNAVKLPRGASMDNCARVAVLRPARRNDYRQLSGKVV